MPDGGCSPLGGAAPVGNGIGGLGEASDTDGGLIIVKESEVLGFKSSATEEATEIGATAAEMAAAAELPALAMRALFEATAASETVRDDGLFTAGDTD